MTTHSFTGSVLDYGDAAAQAVGVIEAGGFVNRE